MRCTWKTLARHCCSPVVQRLHGVSFALNQVLRCTYATAAKPLSKRSSPNISSQNTSSSSNDTERSASPTNLQQLSAAQLAQAAAQAIRLSISAGNLSDAFSILNSLHSASAAPPTPSSESKHRLLIGAIRAHSSKKGRISSRLPAHCLLHGLIRSGNVAQAAQISGQILSAGLSLRSRSLNAVASALGQAGLQVLKHQGHAVPRLHIRAALSQPKFLLPLPSKLSFFTALRPKEVDNTAQGDSNTPSAYPPLEGGDVARRAIELEAGHLTNSIPAQFALQLLALARHARQRRTRAFFKTLITLCLINGEIILASLVFGLVIRDYQSRVEALMQMTEHDQAREDLKVEMTHAAREQLYDICHTVNAALETYPRHSARSLRLTDLDPSTMEEPLQRQATVQALANLAYTVEQGTSQFGGLAPLIKTLGGYVESASQVGTIKEFVWVASEESIQGAELAEASDYFKKVLFYMAHTLVSPHLRPPDIQTHNSLLQFVLFQASLSKSPAEQTELLKPILESLKTNYNGGDEVTHNILTRAKGLFRTAKHIQSIVTGHRPSLSEMVKDVSVSTYTLSTEMMYLIGNGKPQEVTHVINALLPRLRSKKATPESTRALIQRIISLGPVVLSCMLDALRKEGNTILAEHLWRLAREAEKSSLLKDDKPWVLPIHAYTLMMRVYGKEARKTGSRGSEKVKGWGIGAIPHIRRSARDLVLKDEEEEGMSNRLSQRKRRRRRALHLRQTMTKRDMGLYMSIRLYLETMAQERRLQTMSEAQQHTTTVRPPVLDALFFDALLHVINRPSDEDARRKRATLSLSGHKRRLRAVKQAFSYEGRVLPNRWYLSRTFAGADRPIRNGRLQLRHVMDGHGNVDLHALLLTVVADMHSRGIAVPLAFKEAVVGWIDDYGLPESRRYCSRFRVLTPRRRIPVKRGKERMVKKRVKQRKWIKRWRSLKGLNM